MHYFFLLLLIAYTLPHSIFEMAICLLVVPACLIKRRQSYQFLPYTKPEKTKEDIGLEAENQVKSLLSSRNIEHIHDFYSDHPDKTGRLTQTDLLTMSSDGIHVIEVKGHSGMVFVRPNRRFWNVVYPGGFTAKIFNPLWQNDLHKRSVEQLGQGRAAIKSHVIFPNATLRGEKLGNVSKTLPLSWRARRFSLGATRLNGPKLLESPTRHVWDRLLEHERTSNKSLLRQKHLDDLKRAQTTTPDEHDPLADLKKKGREFWVRCDQAGLSATNRRTLLKRYLQANATLPQDPEQQEELWDFIERPVSKRELWSLPVAEDDLVTFRRALTDRNWLPKNVWLFVKQRERHFIRIQQSIKTQDAQTQTTQAQTTQAQTTQTQTANPETDQRTWKPDRKDKTVLVSSEVILGKFNIWRYALYSALALTVWRAVAH